MWILTDNAMEKKLGGDFKDVILLHQVDKDISMLHLYRFQGVYKTYSGFRKFFINHIKPISNKITYISDKSFVGKILKRFYEKN